MKIIAESAFNHNGDLSYLKKLALAAKQSNADFFTVQMMHVDSFCVSNYKKHKLYKETEFSSAEWIQVFDYCKEIEIDVIPCILDEVSLKVAVEYGFRLLKIHATDITNAPLLKEIGKINDLKVILETQCATLFEVNFGIQLIGFDKIDALFSGYSNYPSEVEELNLNVLDTFKKEFNLPVGYADHSLDTSAVPLMLLAKGCKYIEKHITLSRNDRNYDWQVSLYPEEFALMVNSISHYKKALGNGVKHPSLNEKAFRDIMYKKITSDEKTLKRSDAGEYFIENEIKSFDKNNVVIALIARLKSQRLEEKVLLTFHENELIIDLYNRISTAKKVKKTTLATSSLSEDKKLVDLFKEKVLPFYEGHPTSVIDRMLNLAYQEKASSIFRVTGDNPFTDPSLLDEMITMLNDNNLDYVKVNSAPFGVSAELFSTNYLWKLYLKLENPMHSEYLSWYVLNDKDIKMGCIDLTFEEDVELVNLSVDYKEDYLRCKDLLSLIDEKSFKEISLRDIIINSKKLDRVDDTKKIKLPGGNSILLRDYLDGFKNKSYFIRKKINIQ